MSNHNGQRRELSLHHFFKILDVIEDVRQEIGDPGVTMEDVIVQYGIEERHALERYTGAPLAERAA